MLPRLQLTTIAISVVIVLSVIELMRRNRLREEYSILWLLLGVSVALLALSENTLDVLCRLFGTVYPPSAVFLVAFIGCLGLLIHFTVVISHLTRRSIALAQEVGMLRAELDNFANQAAENSSGLDPPGYKGECQRTRG